jgi:hypothetical protein
MGAKLFLQPQLVLDKEEAVLHNVLHPELFFQPQRITHREADGGGGRHSYSITTRILYIRRLLLLLLLLTEDRRIW